MCGAEGRPKLLFPKGMKRDCSENRTGSKRKVGYDRENWGEKWEQNENKRGSDFCRLRLQYSVE